MHIRFPAFLLSVVFCGFVTNSVTALADSTEDLVDCEEQSFHTDLASDLIAHWPLNDGNGRIARDATGNGHAGKLTNGPVWQDDAVVLDGIDDYVNTGLLDVGGQELTITAWVKSEDLENCYENSCRIVSKADGLYIKDQYWLLSTLSTEQGTVFRFSLRTAGVTDDLIADAASIENNRWTHVAAVYNGSKMRLYKNGIQSGRLTKTGEIDIDSNIEAWIGGNPTLADLRPWKGAIADVRIYARALSTAEIKQLYNYNGYSNVDGNATPSFTSLPVQCTKVAANYHYLIQTTDPDADSNLAIQAVYLPDWLTLTDHGDGSAILQGIPGLIDEGEDEVIVQVIDSAGEKSRQQFRLLVINNNTAPSFTSTPKSEAIEDQRYRYEISVTDPDADEQLTLTSVVLPNWLTLTDDRLSGTPGAEDVGTHEVVLKVSDSITASSRQRFTIDVAPRVPIDTDPVSNNLIVFDWNGWVTVADRGFPRDKPPMASANGDWTEPVNYADGTFYFRAEIREQPLVQNMKLQFCVWQYDTSLETCGPLAKVPGSAGTVVTWSREIAKMWKKDGKAIDWVNPRQMQGVAIKNNDGNPVSNYLGWNWFGENPNEWYPLNMRFTVVAVPAGGKFDSWEHYLD